MSFMLYLHQKEQPLSKELAYGEISLPWAVCYCTEAASRLPAKLFDKSASESDTAAREVFFKAQHLGPLLQSEKNGNDVLVWL